MGNPEREPILAPSLDGENAKFNQDALDAKKGITRAAEEDAEATTVVNEEPTIPESTIRSIKEHDALAIELARVDAEIASRKEGLTKNALEAARRGQVQGEGSYSDEEEKNLIDELEAKRAKLLAKQREPETPPPGTLVDRAKKGSGDAEAIINFIREQNVVVKSEAALSLEELRNKFESLKDKRATLAEKAENPNTDSDSAAYYDGQIAELDDEIEKLQGQLRQLESKRTPERSASPPPA